MIPRSNFPWLAVWKNHNRLRAKYKSVSVPKTVEGAIRVDEITPQQNPETSTGMVKPGPVERAGIEAEPSEVSLSRPTPGKLGQGSKGPKR